MNKQINHIIKNEQQRKGEEKENYKSNFEWMQSIVIKNCELVNDLNFENDKLEGKISIV